MNKLNPLYILFLFVVITFLSFYTLNQKKDLYEKSNENLENFTIMAKNYNEIKNSWLNAKKIENRIESIKRSFKNEKILSVRLKDSIKIKYETKDTKKLAKFLNKLLNNKFVFSKLLITQTSVSAQIRLK